eukprot:12906771-Prorocentrum_lima.AAC.1
MRFGEALTEFDLMLTNTFSTEDPATHISWGMQSEKQLGYMAVSRSGQIAEVSINREVEHTTDLLEPSLTALA